MAEDESVGLVRSLFGGRAYDLGSVVWVSFLSDCIFGLVFMVWR
jgi:hypothetical protein